MRKSTFQLLAPAAFAALLGTSVACAEELEIPVGEQGKETYIENIRGLKKDEVSARLGEPLGIQGPVGDPAITRWEYQDFYVYFEWDTVLHTVRKPQG
ncbi:hypothetical protein [Microbulbifer guangxiensis]|uniref:hypothetical protein n=1 Tax=Microbulbifer guangxiensis TaxID=2904249 RepID=UPI001F3DF040|nr:hypothetical protein [Microbulbifer guangxiensis]